MTHHALKDRQQLWQQLQENSAAGEQAWDMIIIGGGITGAGILREAARRGLKALLVEQRDFAWGTSSRSSKMVHGGLRYLGMGDISLTRHSLHERERLLKEVPGLVERMGYYFTLRKKSSPPRWGVKGLLWLYDRIAGIRDHHSAGKQELTQQFPGIDQSELKGSFYYTDAVTDDSRLVLRVLQEAVAAGGSAINYVRVNTLIKSDSDHVQAVSLENVQSTNTQSDETQSSETLEVKAPVIINATGAWADRLRNQLNPEKRVRPLRGSHIVVPLTKLPVSCALTLMHPTDNRAMFIFPWQGRSVIGTTDLDHPQELDIEASISQQEIDYLLEATASLFPATELHESNIISTWAGVRPVIGSDKKHSQKIKNASTAPSKERRDHAVWTDRNLITVSGGKLTTFRLIALDVLNAAKAFLPSATLQATDQPDDDRVFAKVTTRAATLLPENPQLGQQLLNRYGERATMLVQSTAADELQPIADTDFCLAECRWALREEAVEHLDDLLLRRTRLGLLLHQGGAELFTALQQLCQQELSWSEQRWQSELSRYQALWRNHYFLPTKNNKKSQPADIKACAPNA